MKLECVLLLGDSEQHPSSQPKTSLASNGHRTDLLFAHGYDLRRPITSLGAKLAEEFRSQISRPIAHYRSSRHPKMHQDDRIEKTTVFVCTPSPMGYKPSAFLPKCVKVMIAKAMPEKDTSQRDLRVAQNVHIDVRSTILCDNGSTAVREKNRDIVWKAGVPGKSMLCVHMSNERS